MQKGSFGRFLRGFGYAAAGIVAAVREERNLRFHLVATCFVLYFSHFYRFTRAEWMVLIILIAGVIALELVNSAVERAVDSPAPEHYMTAGVAKDMAAGAVLVFSIGAAVCGVLLFWEPQTLQQILAYFLAAWYRLPALAAALIAGYLFVFFYRKRGKED